jgi:hypothetical protein
VAATAGKILADNYTYEITDESGKKAKMTVPKGSVIYPLFNIDPLFNDPNTIYARDQKGNEFILQSVRGVLELVNEKIELTFSDGYKDEKTGERYVPLQTEKNVNDVRMGSSSNQDVRLLESKAKGRDITITGVRTRNFESYSGGKKEIVTKKFFAVSVDGKFIGYTQFDYTLKFIKSLPKLESSDPIPFTNSDLNTLVIGKSLGEFYKRYRYPKTVTIRGDKIIAEFSDIYGQSGRKGRSGGLLLIARNTGADTASAIVTEHKFTETLGSMNLLDYIPFVGSLLLDNTLPLRSFIRGIARQILLDENKYEPSWNDYADKIIKFILPEALQDGFIEGTLSFISTVLGLMFVSTICLPLLLIPYMFVVSPIIGNEIFSNSKIHKMGMTAGSLFLWPVLLLFCLVETPITALIVLIVTVFIGYFMIGTRLSSELAWNRCETCISWESYEFSRYLHEGPWITSTTTQTTKYFKGDKLDRTESSSSSTTYRDVTKEYECSECESTRVRETREYK